MRDIEMPIHNNITATSRSDSEVHPQNAAILVSNPEKVKKELLEKLRKLYIRFDTNPNFYQKSDYKALLDVLASALRYLYGPYDNSIVTEWGVDLDDEHVPSAKLTKQTIDLETTNRILDRDRLSSLILLEEDSRQLADQLLANTKLDNLIAGSNISITDNNVISAVDTIYDDSEILSSIENLLVSKLNVLTPGDNISISNNIISAVDTIYDDTEINEKITAIDNSKLNNLIAGTNIILSNDIISAIDTIYDDTLVNQRIANVENNKLDNLTAGSNISIENNTISAVDTIYDDTVVVSNISALGDRCSTIEEKIPVQATSSNQLADKEFVNSSISTNTAAFKGTYSSVSELEEVSADENDYAFVISTDLAGNTLYNRYKYSNNSWIFEYSLNNSSFTAALWEAIQSGITNSTVTSINAHLDNSNIHVTTLDKLRWDVAELNVQSNWSESNIDSDAYILNKPTTLSSFTDDLGSNPTHTHSQYLTEHLDISGKQDVLTAGTGIDITNNVISNTQTSAEWGNILGTLANQTDLLTVLNSKADTSDIPTVPTNVSAFINDAGYIANEEDPVFMDQGASIESVESEDLEDITVIVEGRDTLTPNQLLLVDGILTERFWFGTLAEYNAIDPKIPTTIYFIEKT